MTLRNLVDRAKDNVRTIDDLAGAGEAMALALATRAAAWVSAIPTIMLTSRTAAQVFGLSAGAGLASAIALEVVGQAVANLWLDAKSWNATKRKADPAANERLALGLTCVYFVTDFVLIATLELPKVFAGDLTHLASLLFPVMQVVSTICLSERVAQFRRQSAIDLERLAAAQERAQKRAQRTAQHDAQEVHKGNGHGAQIGAQEHAQNAVLDAVNRTRRAQKEERLSALVDACEGDPDLGTVGAARLLGVHRNTARNYLVELEAAGRIRRNGHGEEV